VDPLPPAAQRRLIGVALLVGVALAFGQLRGHAFIDLDDGEYIYANPHVLAGLTRDGVGWAFTTMHAANWHPLTWLSHMLDVSCFGLDAGRHHLVSVALHAVSAVALFLVLASSTGATWRSAVAAGLFALHPLHVESVAWAAERKDVLSGLFWMLGMGAYLAYSRRPGLWRYLGVALPFGLGLLSKPMLVTFPLVLLLLDYWPLQRQPPLRALVLEKLPLLGIAILSIAVTWTAQASGQATASAFFLRERVFNALVSYAVYLWRTLWPAGLAVFYPHPSSVQMRVPGWQAAAAAILITALTALALTRARRQPYLIVGWLWFVGTLVPVIGLVQVGAQARADRYTYIPLIGLFIAIPWALYDVTAVFRTQRRILALAWTAALSILASLTWVQAGYWRDAGTLYAHAIEVTKKNWLVWNNLGMFRLERGELPAALDAFESAVRIKPDYADAWYNAGVTLASLGEARRAIAAYREAVRLDGANADGWVNLGLELEALGSGSEAGACYRRALELRPDDRLARARLLGLRASANPADSAQAGEGGAVSPGVGLRP